MKKLLFVVNVDWFFVSHRLPIALEAINQGYDVHLATTITNCEKELTKSGIKVHSLPLVRGKASVFAEIKTFVMLLFLFFRLKPDLVHLVTIKPVLYGGIAARLTRIKAVVAAVSGFGFVFLATDGLARLRKSIVRYLYRIAFSKENIGVIVQNLDDRDELIKISKIHPSKVFLIKGSGVDLSKYRVSPLNLDSKTVVMAARLLADKGVREYVCAARILRERGRSYRFLLAGDLDPSNPSAISCEELSSWIKVGVVDYVGYSTDIATLFFNSTLVVLPSYREGLPKVLVEAAASGRAIVTTFAPGCRDVVIPDVTGMIVPVGDAEKLAEAIDTILSNDSLCASMGVAGRIFAEMEFDIRMVVKNHLYIYEHLLCKFQ